MADAPPRLKRPPLTPEALSRGLLTVAREVWVVQDRLRILEQVLTERGIDVAEAVAGYHPGRDVEEQLKSERDRFAHKLVDAFLGDELGEDGRPARA